MAGSGCGPSTSASAEAKEDAKAGADEVKMRFCTGCKMDRPPGDYTKSGHYCRECNSERGAIRRKEMRESLFTCGICKEEMTGVFFSKYDQRNCKVCAAKKRKDDALWFKQNTCMTCKTCGDEKFLTEMYATIQECHACNKVRNHPANNRPTEDMPDKVCSKCNCELPATMFQFRERVCKDCSKKDTEAWREQNPEKFKTHTARYRAKPDYREKQNVYKRDKYNTDIQNRLAIRLRCRVRDEVKKAASTKRSGEWKDLLGCSMECFIAWLEFRMDERMTWENYGSYWHLDHVKPCSRFDLTDLDQRAECFHWTNFQPLPGDENLAKFNKVDEQMIEAQKNYVKEFLRTQPEWEATLPN